MHSEDNVSSFSVSPIRDIARLDDNEDLFMIDFQTDFIPWHPKVDSFYQKIRRNILSNSENNVSSSSLQDVVIEDPLPNISSLKDLITQFLSPRRPLQPTRVPRKTIPTKHTRLENLNIVLRVLRGYNFPFRMSLPKVQPTRRQQNQNWRESSSMRITNYERPSEFTQEIDELQMKKLEQPGETETIVEILFQGIIYRYFPLDY